MDDEVEKLRAFYTYSNRQQSSHGKSFTRWNPRLAWANYVDTAPVLSLGAIALLSVAGSEAAVERTFSAQGKVHSKARNRMKDPTIEAEMFCRFNGIALERKVEEKDTGSWIELTDDYEEVGRVVTAGLFLKRVVREQEEHENEKRKEEEEQKREVAEEGKEESQQEGKAESESREEAAPAASISRIPDPPVSATDDDVHNFIVSYVKNFPKCFPTGSGIHAKFRWTERYRAHLSDASQRWTPSINKTDKVLQSMIMAYVRAIPPPEPDSYEPEDDIVPDNAEPEL